MAGSKNNLLWRLLVGAVLIALVVLACFTHRLAIFALVEIIIALASYEFIKIAALKNTGLNYYLTVGLNLFFPVFAYFHWPTTFLLIGAFLAIALYGIFKKIPSPLAFFSGSVFSLIYLGFLPTHLLLLKQLVLKHGLSNGHLLFPLLFTWINDTAAYGFGAAFGRHKLISRLSPKKSWEGTIAGLIFAVATALGYWWFWFRTKPFWYFLILGMVLSLLALVGDLFESSFKREVGLKDSSRILPGHGGILDRVDSLLFTVPGFYYFLLLIGL